MVQINWTIQARGDLREISDYISIDSAKYAKYQIYKILETTNLLKTQSRIGRMVPEFENPLLRELICGNYRIIYKLVTDFRIDILTIHHSARNLTKRNFK